VDEVAHSSSLHKLSSIHTTNRGTLEMSCLPEGKRWIRHDGKKQKLRNLRNICRPTLDFNDPEVRVALLNLTEIVAQDPEPQYALYSLIRAAQEASNDTGVSIQESINYIVDKYGQEEK